MGNEDQSGQSDIAWFVQRHADSSKLLRSHYESLLSPSRSWRSWATGRISDLRSISVVLPNGRGDGGIARAGILLPTIYRWISAALTYGGSPFYWPRVPLFWYSPLWRLWSQMPPSVETEPAEATGLGYYGAGEHLAAPSPLIELPSLDWLPSGPLLQDDLMRSRAEALPGPRTSHLSLAALPSRLSPARMLTSHGIVSIPVLLSPELAFHPDSLLYPETGLVYHSISTLLRMWAHPKLPDSSDEQGVSPYTYWEPTPALTQNVPLLHHLTPSSAVPVTSGPLTLQRLPILSSVAPAVFADDAGMRRFDSPLLSMASLPLTTSVYLEPSGTSWPSLDMLLVSSIHSGLVQARSFDMEDLASRDTALDEEQAEVKEAPSPVARAGTREIAPAVQNVQSQGAEVPSSRMALSRNIPYVPKPEMVVGTFAASLLRELVNRREGMLVSAKEVHLDEEGPQSMAIMYPSVTQPLAVFKPDEPYLRMGAGELLPTIAAHQADDAIMSPIAQARSTAFAVSRYPGHLPLTHKALYPTPQQVHSLGNEDDLYSTPTPMAGAARVVGDMESAQAPYHEETGPSVYGLEQILSVGEPARTVADLESILTRPYDVTGPRPGGPQQRGQSSRPSPASQPQNAPAGYGGWSLPVAASFASPPPSSAPQATVARAPIDRPTNGGQTGDTSQNVPLDEIAEDVYAILKRRLALERERSWGIG